MEKTPLNNTHKLLGAKMTDFGGWEMPVEYSSIIDEHHAVRNQAGLFDVSHMGEILLSGNDSRQELQRLITNDAEKLENGKVLYTPICREDGGIIDDLLVYQLAEDNYLLVVNAANTQKDFNWIQKELAATANREVQVENLSKDFAMLALQGPHSGKILSGLTNLELENINYYQFREAEAAGVDMIISRTGYTGELGYELYFDSEKAEEVWQKIIKAGEEYKLMPAGLGARNTLRLEKGYALYGNDIDENTNPLEAGLSWTVDLNGDYFIGQEKLQEINKDCCSRRLKGFKITGRGLARHGYEIYDDDKKIGQVTSGSYSPTLKENIGMAYIENSYTALGSSFKIKVRKRFVDAEVSELPFVK